MSIALYDKDYVESNMRFVFNLQLMKLATYYKKQRELVSLITDLSRAKYYDKVFYRQEDPNFSFPKEIYEYSNIDIGGFAVDGCYKEMEKEIERCNPDTTIYNWRKKMPWLSKHDQTYLKQQERGQHIILSTNKGIYQNEKLLCGANHNVFIHDTLLNNGWDKELERIGKQSISEEFGLIIISFCNDITITKFSELETIMKYEHGLYNHKIFYKSPLSKTEFNLLYCNNSNRGWLKEIVILEDLSNLTLELRKMKLIELTERILLSKAYGKKYHFESLGEIPQAGFKCLYLLLSKWNTMMVLNESTNFHDFVIKANNIKFDFNYQQRLFCLRKIEEEIPELKLLFRIDPMIIADNGGKFPI